MCTPNILCDLCLVLTLTLTLTLNRTRPRDRRRDPLDDALQGCVPALQPLPPGVARLHPRRDAGGEERAAPQLAGGGEAGASLGVEPARGDHRQLEQQRLLGRGEQALEAYEKAAEIAHDSRTVRFNVGLMYFRNKRLYEAEISSEYIHSLNIYYNKWIAKIESAKVLVIQTDDFNIFKDIKAYEDIISLVKKKLYEKK